MVSVPIKRKTFRACFFVVSLLFLLVLLNSCSLSSRPENTVRRVLRSARRENTAALGDMLTAAALRTFTQRLFSGGAASATALLLAGVPAEAANITLYFTRTVPAGTNRMRISFFHSYERDDRELTTGVYTWTLEKTGGGYRVASL